MKVTAKSQVGSGEEERVVGRMKVTAKYHGGSGEEESGLSPTTCRIDKGDSEVPWRYWRREGGRTDEADSEVIWW